jgi:integrase/recombinase XerD
MELLFTDPRTIERVRSGPLGSYIQQLVNNLRQQGYRRGNSRWRVRIAHRFAHWIAESRIAVENLTPTQIDRFVERYCKIKQGDAKTLRMFFDILVENGVVSRMPEPAPTEAQRLVDEFATYLQRQRALSPRTIESYRQLSRSFLDFQFRGKPISIAALRAQDVIALVQHEARRKCAGSAKNTTVALRSYLRFAHYSGILEHDFSAAVPTVADWALASIPRGLTEDEVRRVLESCNRQTSVGRRDYAVLLLLARLGLRASEVATLTLDDIRWDTGTILVHGKGGKPRKLPLLADVGKAIAIYLKQDRPTVPSRRVFLRVPAPHTELRYSSAICLVVQNALLRASLQTHSKGAHQFRHALATEMLKRGASLTDIGEVLRHEKPKTTFIYAKVDFASLRPIALPWPGDLA